LTISDHGVEFGDIRSEVTSSCHASSLVFTAQIFTIFFSLIAPFLKSFLGLLHLAYIDAQVELNSLVLRVRDVSVERQLQQ
jgi:hypothetical protein